MPRSKSRLSKTSAPKLQIQIRNVVVISIILIFCVVNIFLPSYYLPHPRDNNGAPTNNDHGAISPFFQPYTINRNNTNKVDAIKNSTNRVLEYFYQAGVELDDESLQRLPSWEQIESLIGDKPVLLGLERCEDFRNNIPPLRRMLGSAGMFNSGTNLVTRLMKENCVIPERFNKWGPNGSKEDYGIRWQCPWGKHTPAMFKYNHSAPKNENVTKDDCLPVVTVRNPFDWMSSMCRLPYTAKWDRHERWKPGEICPHLVHTSDPENAPVEVVVKLAEQLLRFDSLAHLWNEWYAQYERDATYPFLIVRFEDLTFRQHETTKIICECAGGKVKPKKMFKYIINSAKQGPGHGKKEERTGMVDAWIKYGKPKEVKAGFSDEDWEASLKFLSHDFVEKLDYRYPPSE